MRKKINFIGVQEAAELTGLPAQTIRVGLQQGVFPWGYVIRSEKGQKCSYYINKTKLEAWENGSMTEANK